jgi:hypothetical protein
MTKTDGGSPRPVTVPEYKAMIAEAGESSAAPTDPFITPEIRLTDSDGTYRVYHYVTCDEKSPAHVQATRGTIRRATDGKIVCATAGFTPEHVGKNDASLAAARWVLAQPGLRLTTSVEATNVRVWFDAIGTEGSGQWRISTFKKLSAYKSRWGSRDTHGDLFEAAVAAHVAQEFANGNPNFSAGDFSEGITRIRDAFLATLRRDRIYTFAVCPRESNRVVCKAPEVPTMYFSGEYDASRFVPLDANTSGVPRAVKIEKPETAEEFLDMVEAMDPKKAQGVIASWGEYTAETCAGHPYGAIKFTSSAYKALEDVRGNVPSIPFRYLQLRGDDKMRNALIDLYPEAYDSFVNYECILTAVGSEIHAGYVARYLDRQFVTLPQEQFYVMRALHDLYLQDPKKYRMPRNSTTLVMQYLNGLDAFQLNRLIRASRERAAAAAESTN